MKTFFSNRKNENLIWHYRFHCIAGFDILVRLERYHCKNEHFILKIGKPKIISSQYFNSENWNKKIISNLDFNCEN